MKIMFVWENVYIFLYKKLFCLCLTLSMSYCHTRWICGKIACLLKMQKEQNETLYSCWGWLVFFFRALFARFIPHTRTKRHVDVTLRSARTKGTIYACINKGWEKKNENILKWNMLKEKELFYSVVRCRELTCWTENSSKQTNTNATNEITFRVLQFLFSFRFGSPGSAKKAKKKNIYSIFLYVCDNFLCIFGYFNFFFHFLYEQVSVCALLDFPFICSTWTFFVFIFLQSEEEE